MTTCSTDQIDSNPHFSAVVTRWVNKSGWLKGPELKNIRPIFMACLGVCELPVNLTRGVNPMETENSRCSRELVPNCPQTLLTSHGTRKSRSMVLPRCDDRATVRGFRANGRKTRLPHTVDPGSGRPRTLRPCRVS